MSLIAKPIVKNQLWVVTDGSNKVGKVEYTDNRYSVKIGNKLAYFDSTSKIENMVAIKFQRPEKSKIKKQVPYAIWPTSGRTYNNLYDLQRKLHIYTKSSRSKCYFAAGWFKINLNGSWQTIFCPKYIFVQRYEYVGPFLTEEQAKNN